MTVSDVYRFQLGVAADSSMALRQGGSVTHSVFCCLQCNDLTLPRGACANGCLRRLFQNCSGEAAGALAPAADTGCQPHLYAVHFTSSEMRLAWCTCCWVLLCVNRCCNTRHLFLCTPLSPPPLHFIPCYCGGLRALSEEPLVPPLTRIPCQRFAPLFPPSLVTLTLLPEKGPRLSCRS